MNEPRIEAALKEAAALEGWDFFEHLNDPKKGAAASPAAAERAERAAASLARLFGSDPGFRDALEFLLDGTLRRALLIAPLELDPMKGYAYGQFREGQNACMWWILKLIAMGRKEPPEPSREPA